jgi:hypothetical protein
LLYFEGKKTVKKGEKRSFSFKRADYRRFFEGGGRKSVLRICFGLSGVGNAAAETSPLLRGYR